MHMELDLECEVQQTCSMPGHHCWWGQVADAWTPLCTWATNGSTADPWLAPLWTADAA